MIKNIIFDVDGVLINLDSSYHKFLQTSYPEYKNMKIEEMAELFPIDGEDGAFELPSRFSKDFIDSPYYVNRPFFKNTISVLKKLKSLELTLITLSAASSPEKKLSWLADTFGDLFNAYELSPAGVAKDEGLKTVINKYGLNKAETLFIDDRFFNIRAGLRAGVEVARMQPDLFLPLPKDLSHVRVLYDIEEIFDLIS
ncbi:MAG: HAD family hydrolase [Lactobacillaceae bacterium]|jgi:HAD superfamily hydrolase (TIGR01509 family)|nr:HAD family hydrolase [Lactobacillaceae bacterium]